MGTYSYIGDVLLFLIALPIFAFQSLEMLNALVDFFAEVSRSVNHYK